MKKNPMQSEWKASCWQDFEAKQQPDWPDKTVLQTTKNSLSKLPPLVFAGEIRSLEQELTRVENSEAFVLQGGDCAEEFSQCTAPTIRENLKVLLQMAVILTYSGQKKIVKIGRIAGQYAKPRSKSTEMVGGIEMPSYRGDMVNLSQPDLESRIAKPSNLLSGYFYSAATLNILRAFTRGGFANLENSYKWTAEFVQDSPVGKKYQSLTNEIQRALVFMRTVGLDPQQHRQLREVTHYTSHEGLLLDYEESMVRQDSLTGLNYDCSAHLLWIGERTNQSDGAHVEFFKGVNNPLGMKVGQGMKLDDLRRSLDKLNPENKQGKIMLITRLGANIIGDTLPKLIRAVQQEGHNVVWCCDPMHGNTYQEGSYKTRDFSAIIQEIKHFFQIHTSEGSIPGGVHLELTGLDVTECVGGGQKISAQELSGYYQTICDPRLNAQQSLELAFEIADLLK